VHFYSSGSLNPMILKKVRPSGRVFVSQLKFSAPKTYERLAAAQPHVDRYLAGCVSIQEDLLEAGIDRQRTFMVPPCLNIGRWESAMLIKPAMAHKRVYKVGTVSMDRTLREQELFLLMAKEVLEVQPETNFMVVGLKEERIRQLARNLGISHKVDVLWERTDMPEVMAMMDIYAKTSRRDGMSLSLMEAQASGVACIVPRLRGLSDFIVNDHSGLIVEPEDILGYTRAVVRLLADPQLCQKMAKEAFGYVNDNMSVPVVANLLVRLYEEALAV
jgi:glycosyltransferase involved in cell wall biosynthesis